MHAHQAMTDTRPLLLLDVDGALSADAMGRPDLYGYTEYRTPGGRAVLSRDVCNRLLALADRYDLTWCTGWNDRANEHLCPLIGWPEIPVLDLAEARRRYDEAYYRGDRVRHPEHSWKLQAVQEHVGERPFAWVDDQIGHDTVAWTAARPQPSLLVVVSAGHGLLDHHFAELVAWADNLTPGQTIIAPR